MGRHDETSEIESGKLSNRRLKAIARRRRILRERYAWRGVTGALVAAIVGGSLVATLTGNAAAAEADATSPAAVNVVQASWAVDEVIEEIDAELAQEAADRAAEKAAKEEAEAAEAAAAAEAEAEAERIAAEEAAAAEAAANPDWISPSDSRITSNYGTRNGSMHNGVDFGNWTGDPIWAIADGTVIYADFMDGFGNLVIVDHGDGIETYYAHASELVVSAGQSVEQGETISLTGSTGNSTGPHLHFEVRIDGEPTEPLNWLAEHGVDI